MKVIHLKTSASRLACAVAILAFAFAAGAATGAGLYKWVDDQGVVHYTDKMPPE